MIARTLLALLQLPFRTIRFGVGVLPSVLSWGVSAVAVLGNRVLPGAVSRWLRGALHRCHTPKHLKSCDTCHLLQALHGS
jgi:hypothetical protein